MAKNKVLYAGALAEDTRNIMNHNFSDVSVASATLSATSSDTGTTLTNIAGLTTDTNPNNYLQAGGTYKFRIHLSGVATANSGMKIGLKQNNGLTLTSIESSAVGTTASAVVCQHSTTTTDAASLMASTTAFLKCVIEGTFVVLTSGSLQVQGAQNASHADTTSFYLGSYMTVEHITTG